MLFPGDAENPPQLDASAGAVSALDTDRPGVRTDQQAPGSVQPPATELTISASSASDRASIFVITEAR